MAVLDVKDMFFQYPICSDNQARFAFTWNGIQYTFTRLPQDYCHTPTIVHGLLASALAEISPTPDVSHHQYIDDILLGGPTCKSVAQDMTLLISSLKERWDLSVPSGKCLSLAQNVIFLGLSLCVGT